MTDPTPTTEAGPGLQRMRSIAIAALGVALTDELIAEAQAEARAGLDVETRDLIDQLWITHGRVRRSWRRSDGCATCHVDYPCSTTRLLAALVRQEADRE